jgi:hypothetical protein
VWPVILLLAVLDAAGLYLLVGSYRADAAEAAQREAARRLAATKPPEPEAPPPPEMIHPPAIADVLQSGTLIVISKASQNMHVFQDGILWASTPVSTGKRRHETPSGVFPILQKRRHHRSNIYSNAPMPFMQRLSWEGIALHAGYVPGYPASHGCVRMPRAFAQALFKLTRADATTVVIGDDPIISELDAQHYALTANLPIRSALAPPDPSRFELARAAAAQISPVLASIAPLAPAPKPTPPPPPPAPPAAAPLTGSQTIQLTAAPSQAEAEAHWATLLKSRPDLRRFAKRVEPAQVNTRQVYRLRISGEGAHGTCAKLRSEGVGCLEVS